MLGNVLADGATALESVPFMTGAGGVTAAVMLAGVIWWLLRVHLPAKDAQVERLIDRGDKRDQERVAAFAAALDRVVAHCAEEAHAATDYSEKRHAEVLALLQKIHESSRESVHATRNMDAAVRSRTRLADALQSAEVPVWTKSLDGTLMSWNAAAERLLGWRQGEVVGQSVYARLIPKDRRTEEEEVLRAVARGSSPVEYETERLARDGRLVPLSVTTSPIRDQAGRVVGASTIARSLDPQ